MSDEQLAAMTPTLLVQAFERAALRWGASDPGLCFDPARQIHGENCERYRKEILRRLTAPKD